MLAYTMVHSEPKCSLVPQIEHGLVQSIAFPCLYVEKHEGKPLFLDDQRRLHDGDGELIIGFTSRRKVADYRIDELMDGLYTHNFPAVHVEYDCSA